jgi:hypothetical protein
MTKALLLAFGLGAVATFSTGCKRGADANATEIVIGEFA